MPDDFNFEIECIQTDNDFEFTNRLNRYNNKTVLFEQELAKLTTEYRLTHPFALRHNGKVEQSHPKDIENFYTSHKFYSFENFKKRLYIHNWKYNNFPVPPLGWISPKGTLKNYFSVCSICLANLQQKHKMNKK